MSCPDKMIVTDHLAQIRSSEIAKSFNIISVDDINAIKKRILDFHQGIITDQMLHQQLRLRFITLAAKDKTLSHATPVPRLIRPGAETKLTEGQLLTLVQEIKNPITASSAETPEDTTSEESQTVFSIIAGFFALIASPFIKLFDKAITSIRSLSTFTAHPDGADAGTAADADAEPDADTDADADAKTDADDDADADPDADVEADAGATVNADADADPAPDATAGAGTAPDATLTPLLLTAPYVIGCFRDADETDSVPSTPTSANTRGARVQGALNDIGHSPRTDETGSDAGTPTAAPF